MRQHVLAELGAPCGGDHDVKQEEATVAATDQRWVRSVVSTSALQRGPSAHVGEGGLGGGALQPQSMQVR